MLERFKFSISAGACLAAGLLFSAPAGADRQPKLRQETKIDRAIFVQLFADDRLIPPAAIYSCPSMQKDLQCSSERADDTAHLSENPNAVILLLPARLRVRKDARLKGRPVAFYLAEDVALLDTPHYGRLTVRNTLLQVPTIKKRSVVVATFTEPVSGLIDKSVWLVSPAL